MAETKNELNVSLRNKISQFREDAGKWYNNERKRCDPKTTLTTKEGVPAPFKAIHELLDSEAVYLSVMLKYQNELSYLMDNFAENLNKDEKKTINEIREKLFNFFKIYDRTKIFNLFTHGTDLTSNDVLSIFNDFFTSDEFKQLVTISSELVRFEPEIRKMSDKDPIKSLLTINANELIEIKPTVVSHFTKEEKKTQNDFFEQYEPSYTEYKTKHNELTKLLKRLNDKETSIFSRLMPDKEKLAALENAKTAFTECEIKLKNRINQIITYSGCIWLNSKTIPDLDNINLINLEEHNAGYIRVHDDTTSPPLNSVYYVNKRNHKVEMIATTTEQLNLLDKHFEHGPQASLFDCGLAKNHLDSGHLSMINSIIAHKHDVPAIYNYDKNDIDLKETMSYLRLRNCAISQVQRILKYKSLADAIIKETDRYNSKASEINSPLIKIDLSKQCDKLLQQSINYGATLDLIQADSKIATTTKEMLKAQSGKIKTKVLNYILDMDLNNPLQDKSLMGITSANILIDMMLNDIYPNNFIYNKDNIDAALIRDALGIRGAGKATFDVRKFDHKKLQQLYNQYKNSDHKTRATLFAVLESTKPIDATFSPTDKVNAYIRVATQYSNGAIFKDGSKRMGVLAMAKAAYAIAGQYPETKAIVDKAFAPILNSTAKKPSKAKIKAEREQGQFGNWLIVRIPNCKLEMETAYLKGRLEQESTRFNRRQKVKPDDTKPTIKTSDASKEGLYLRFKSFFDKEKKKENVLISLLTLHMNTPIQKTYEIKEIQSQLAQQYPAIFFISKDKLNVRATHPKYLLISEALELPSTLDFHRFNLAKLNELISSTDIEEKILFKVLKTMIPVNDAQVDDKINNYKEVMLDIYNKKLALNGRGEIALLVAKSAYSIAGQYNQPKLVEPYFGTKKTDLELEHMSKEERKNSCSDGKYGDWIAKKTLDTHNTRLELEHAFAQGSMQKKTLVAQTVINDMQSKKNLYSYTSMASTARMVNIAKEQMRVAGPLPENKKSNALRHILNLHMNTPLQKLEADGKPVITPTLFSDYLKTLLVTAYPEFFVLEKGQFKVNPMHKDQALLQTALGLDGKSGLLDCNKFDPEALQQLAIKYKNNRDMNFPLFAVLESTKPVNALFSAEEKMGAYERIAQAFYDQKIGKTKEAMGAMVVLKSAESVAKVCEDSKNPKPMQMFNHAFSSTKEKAPKIAHECSNGRFGNWITRGGSSDSKNDDSDRLTPRRIIR